MEYSCLCIVIVNSLKSKQTCYTKELLPSCVFSKTILYYTLSFMRYCCYIYPLIFELFKNFFSYSSLTCTSLSFNNIILSRISISL
nr:MAG TPA: hypothetical protein [Bacteriophage sp.]